MVTDSLQSPLFEVLETQQSVAELFPALWQAAEGLVSPISEDRRAALRTLTESQAQKISPLIAYLIATKITDKDIYVRKGAVSAIGAIFEADEEGRVARLEVHRVVHTYLSAMRRREIFGLLQVWNQFSEVRGSVLQVLKQCAYSGDTLIDIFSDRGAPLEVRRAAIEIIGEMGYVNALPAIERLLRRLESANIAQKKMVFAPMKPVEEQALVKTLRMSLSLLK